MNKVIYLFIFKLINFELIKQYLIIILYILSIFINILILIVL